MNDDFQKKIIRFQMMEANLKALQERAGMLSERVQEIESTKNSIEDLKNVKPSSALIPIGSSTFVHGRIESSDEVIVGIGGGIAIKKKREDAVATLECALKEMEKNLDEVKVQITNLAFEMEKLQEELERLQK
ncbi:MAG: prefoldin subunit alpha [Candidatus Aenigmatarchaeota archaeon]